MSFIVLCDGDPCKQCGRPASPPGMRRTCEVFTRDIAPTLPKRDEPPFMPPSSSGREPSSDCVPMIDGQPIKLLDKTWTYAKALAKWTAAGWPRRTTEEIAAAFAICESCPLFNAKAIACRACGCALGKQENGFTNKIAMATESCPLDPPRWGAAV